MNGRWNGSEFVWECPSCHFVLCAKDAPKDEGSMKCLGCRALDDSTQAFLTLSKLVREMHAWKLRALKAESDLAEVTRAMGALVDGAEATKKAIERADTDPPPANDVH